jgi:hypothetical protein
MKRKLWLFALVAAVLLSAAPVLADGDFYVVAVGGGVGTKITSLPKNIDTPGFYYLTSNLSYSGTSDGITIGSDDVTIDLMGFRLIGPGSSSSSHGIKINGHKNVEVRNGSLNGWFAGLTDFTGLRNRALNLRVENCGWGIDFEGLGGGGYLIKGCSVEVIHTGIRIYGGVATGNVVINCDHGIDGLGTISGNSASNCPAYGILCNGGSLIGNTVVNPTGGAAIGIQIATPDPVLVTQNTVSGPGTHFATIGGSATVNVNNAGF